MPSTLNSDNGSVSGSAGLKSSADSSGVLALQTNGTTAVTVNASQNVGIGTASPADILHLSSTAPRFTFTSTNNTSGARYDTVGTATTGSHRFQYNGTEVLTVGITGQTVALQGASPASGAGITFPATQSASTDVNTLDDYEEGTWTPSVGGTATYTQRVARYTKVGNVVVVVANILINTIGTGSASTISGFPFNAASDTLVSTVNFAYFGSLTTAMTFLTAYISSGGTTTAFAGLATSSATIGNGISVIGSGTNLYFTATYRTD